MINYMLETLNVAMRRVSLNKTLQSGILTECIVQVGTQSGILTECIVQVGTQTGLSSEVMRTDFLLCKAVDIGK